MGCAGSVQADPKSKLIDDELRRSKSERRTEVRLLTLGASESGKSTVIKQFQITNGQLSDERRERYKSVVQKFVAGLLKILIKACQRFEIQYSDPAVQNLAEQYMEMKVDDVLTEETSKLVTKLFREPAIKRALEQRDKYYLPECCDYFLEHIDRVCSTSYSPTVADIVRVRQRTTGINETTFAVNKTFFRVIDVGGQRTERKKWIHCFQDVTALLYVIALDEYDMRLAEDPSVNRMLESIKLFQDTTSSTYLATLPLIIFFNKCDLLKAKLPRSDPSVLFASSYNGGSNYDAALAFLRDAYLKVLPADRQVHTHVTNALSEENIRAVWNAVVQIVVNINLNLVSL